MQHHKQLGCVTTERVGCFNTMYLEVIKKAGKDTMPNSWKPPVYFPDYPSHSHLWHFLISIFCRLKSLSGTFALAAAVAPPALKLCKPKSHKEKPNLFNFLLNRSRRQE